MKTQMQGLKILATGHENTSNAIGITKKSEKYERTVRAQSFVKQKKKIPDRCDKA